MNIEQIITQAKNAYANIWINSEILRLHEIGTNAYDKLNLCIKRHRAEVERVRVLYLTQVSTLELQNSIFTLDQQIEKYANTHPSHTKQSGYHSLVSTLNLLGQEWTSRNNSNLKPPACDSRHASTFEVAGGAL